jgi:hypothetical protein
LVLLFNETLLAPVLESVTAPTRLLLPPLVDKLMAPLVALKLDVPLTLIAPVCEIAA